MPKKSSDDGANEERQHNARIFGTRANSMRAWRGAAGALLRVCELLDAEIDFLRPTPVETRELTEAEDRAAGVYLSQQAGMHAVHQMLRGMAVEAMLKALWLKAEKKLATAEVLIGLAGHKGHDLRRMANAVLPLHGIELTTEEWALLDTWRRYITQGRYPIPTRAAGEHLGFEDSWDVKRDAVALELLRKLYEALD